MFHCLAVPHFVYPFLRYASVFGLFPLSGCMNDAAMNVGVESFLRMCVLVFLTTYWQVEFLGHMVTLVLTF